jgi:phosphate starvation-inducible PhoH-like protein
MPIKKAKLSLKDFKDISLTPKQRLYSQSIQENTITFCWGPAGSSKTFSACYAGLTLLAKGICSKIIFTKPIQESGEKLGSLPGTVDEKIAPYRESFITNIEKIISKEKSDQLFAEGFLEFRPLAFMRGSTFDDAVMILDEAQNCDMKQLMLHVTRVGNNTKAVIAGDVTQHDISYDKVALPTFINLVRGVNGISEVTFTEDDIVRSEILKEIVKRYEEWKHSSARESNGNGSGKKY